MGATDSPPGFLSVLLSPLFIRSIQGYVEQALSILSGVESVEPSSMIIHLQGLTVWLAIDSMVSAGCIVSGSLVRRSLLSYNVRVHSYSQINDSVILPDVEIGRYSRINRAIIDTGCRLPEGTQIGIDPSEDAKHFHVSPEGIVLVSAEMLQQAYPNLA